MARRGTTLKWTGRVAVYILICLAILSGCVYPSLNDVSSSRATAVQGGVTQGPLLTVDPSPAGSTPSVLSSPSPRIPSQVVMPAPSSTPTLHTQAPAQYDLDVTLDYEQHTLSVDEEIKYKNLSSDSLADLILVIEPNLSPGGFTLLSMTWENGDAIEPSTLENNLLRIPLLQPLQPGTELRIKLSYNSSLPELTDISIGYRPVAFGYSSAQTNLADWYPYVPPYRTGKGWLVHTPWVFGEYQVYDVADFNVNVTLARPDSDLVIAAPAPALKDGDRYTYHLEAARTFTLSASTEYIVQAATVGEVTIYSYSFLFDKYAGQEALDTTADAVRLYSQLFTPYQHTILSVVEADFLDGMEYDGLYFLSRGFYDLYDGTPKGYLTFIAAHETAHQWWYGLVGNDQALEPWLDEALCTYMERVFYENIYSEYPPGSGGSLVDWWWYYRVNFYHPVGWVDDTLYDFVDTRAYRDAIYLNGAKFLEDLRNLVGDQAFFAALKDYATNNAYKIATAQDFFASVRRHTSQNLDGILSSYFQSSK
jgi:hypothetical protein